MKKRSMILLLIISLVIGFASVSTTLVINGVIGISHNTRDFQVIFTSAMVYGSSEIKATISEDKKTINFETDKLSIVGDSAKLVYKVKNNSTQYDARVSINCTGGNEEYLNIVGEFAGNDSPLTTPELMLAQEVRMGSLNVELTKEYGAEVTKVPITCRIEVEGEERDTKVSSVCEYSDGTKWDFLYTEGEQEFKVPCDGEYKVELWGAQGGDSTGNSTMVGATGGYTSGNILFEQNQLLYIYVGGHGENGKVGINSKGGYNGGGKGTTDGHDDETSGGGGGATDVRLFVSEDKLWSNFDSLKSRIMVAGAGGGSSFNYKSGAAGGLSGYSTFSISIPGSQTGGYQFGIGRDGWGVADSDGVGGGGAGYYGGQTSNTICKSSGAGGSSFISGHAGCNAITEDSTSSNITHTGNADHYSGYIFANTKMIDGAGYAWTNTRQAQEQMPNPTGGFYNLGVGHSGNGYARITLVSSD